MPLWFSIFIVIWVAFFIGLLFIGGYFMFRKFLKSMPRTDGWSDLDWQDYYIDQTRQMWSKEQLLFLTELVAPVPELFRDIAKRSIAAKIGKLALDEKAERIDQDLIIRGYIEATPPRDYKFLIKRLEQKNIDIVPYRQYLSTHKET